MSGGTMITKRKWNMQNENLKLVSHKILVKNGKAIIYF